MAKVRKTGEHKDIARERIKTLFFEAEDAPLEYANRYVELARKLSMKYKVAIPSEFKRRFCKHCYAYLRPGKSCTVRLQDSKVVYLCHTCKKYSRFPYRKEQKEKRK